MQTTQPTTVGYVSKPLLVADSTTSGYFINYRGEVIPASQATTTANFNYIYGGNFDTNNWLLGTSIVSPVNAAHLLSNWMWGSNNSTGAVTISNATDAPTFAQAGIYSSTCLKILVTTGQSSLAAGDFFDLQYRIEGIDWRLMVGQALSLSFWVKATVTGTYCVCLQASTPNQQYIGTYTISNATTWEYKTIAIPASMQRNLGHSQQVQQL